jgi:cation transport ATPase
LAGGIEESLLTLPYVSEAKASHVTGSVVIFYDEGRREEALGFVRKLTPIAAVGERAQDMGLNVRRRFILKFLSFAIRRFLLPMWLRIPIVVWQSRHYLFAAAEELRRGKIGVSVLDEAAVLASMLSGDFNLASSIILLLGLGEILEEHTREVAR